MTKDIALNDLPLESIKVQLLDSFEEVSDTLQVIDKNWKRLERFGKLLIAAKTKVPHGEWEDWLVDTFQGRLQLRTAQRWISDVKFPAKAEARREKDREAKASKATDLSLLESEESKGSVEVLDPDPAPDPPTNRKTAKGSEKVPDAAKPRTQQVPVEIIEADEPAAPFVVEHEDGAVILRESDTDGIRELFRRCVIVDEGDLRFVIESLIRKTENKHGQKKLAGVLRKWGNELDPPTKFRRPESDDVLVLLREYAATKEFIEKYGKRTDLELAIAAEGFLDHYDGNGWLIGKAAMKDWQATARKWLRNQPQFSNGKANGNGHRTSETSDNGSCLGPNGRPRVERAKVTYK